MFNIVNSDLLMIGPGDFERFDYIGNLGVEEMLVGRVGPNYFSRSYAEELVGDGLVSVGVDLSHPTEGICREIFDIFFKYDTGYILFPGPKKSVNFGDLVRKFPTFLCLESFPQRGSFWEDAVGPGWFLLFHKMFLSSDECSKKIPFSVLNIAEVFWVSILFKLSGKFLGKNKGFSRTLFNAKYVTDLQTSSCDYFGEKVCVTFWRGPGMTFSKNDSGKRIAAKKFE